MLVGLFPVVGPLGRVVAGGSAALDPSYGMSGVIECRCYEGPQRVILKGAKT
jgi:hypothetical protein